MKRYISFFVLLLVCVSCKDRHMETVKNEVVGRIGTIIMLPDSLQYRTLTDSLVPIPDKTLKIVTVINGECFLCLNSFIEWKKEVEEFSSFGDVAILFYVTTSDFESLRKPLKDIEFDYPFFIDPNSDILFNNNIPLNKSTLHTFLLDKDNKIVLIGSPLGNPKLADLYKHQIQQLSQKQAKK